MLNILDLQINSRTREPDYKLLKRRSRLDIRKHSLSQTVVNKWNELPELVVEALVVSRLIVLRNCMISL